MFFNLICALTLQEQFDSEKKNANKVAGVGYESSQWFEVPFPFEKIDECTVFYSVEKNAPFKTINAKTRGIALMRLMVGYLVSFDKEIPDLKPDTYCNKYFGNIRDLKGLLPTEIGASNGKDKIRICYSFSNMFLNMLWKENKTISEAKSAMLAKLEKNTNLIYHYADIWEHIVDNFYKDDDWSRAEYNFFITYTVDKKKWITPMVISTYNMGYVAMKFDILVLTDYGKYILIGMFGLACLLFFVFFGYYIVMYTSPMNIKLKAKTLEDKQNSIITDKSKLLTMDEGI